MVEVCSYNLTEPKKHFSRVTNSEYNQICESHMRCIISRVVTDYHMSKPHLFGSVVDTRSPLVSSNQISSKIAFHYQPKMSGLFWSEAQNLKNENIWHTFLPLPFLAKA